MIVVLAIDALEYTLVERFDCRNLKQKFYGKTDITEFSEPRTMVLWASFLSGKNMEAEVLSLGDKAMWGFKLDRSKTFLSRFEDPIAIDLPAFSYDEEQHMQERIMIRRFFETDDDAEKTRIKKEYNNHAFTYHNTVKEKFQAALNENHDFVLGYFSIADVIGHLNFGNRSLMRMIYRDLDEVAAWIHGPLIVLSDHGMKEVGIFGDHSCYGFWSSDSEDLKTPKITDFSELICDR